MKLTTNTEHFVRRVRLVVSKLARALRAPNRLRYQHCLRTNNLQTGSLELSDQDAREQHRVDIAAREHHPDRLAPGVDPA